MEQRRGSMMKGIVEFLQTYPHFNEDAGEMKLQYEGIDPCKINFLSQGTDIIETFINAQVKRAYTVYVTIPDYDESQAFLLEKSGFLEHLEDWLMEKNILRELPQVLGTNVFSCDYIDAYFDSETGSYEIQLQFIYEKE